MKSKVGWLLTVAHPPKERVRGPEDVFCRLLGVEFAISQGESIPLRFHFLQGRRRAGVESDISNQVAKGMGIIFASGKPSEWDRPIKGVPG